MTNLTKSLLVSMLALTAVSACDRERSNSVRFDGNYYPAKGKAVEAKAPADFVVTVSNVAQGLEGARQAGEYEATKYCIQKLGTSDVIWQIGPDADETAIGAASGTLTLAGSCVE
ncbi:hypothetical protein [Pseudoprimorskyibacter insulae]|uniref:Lipoprotein n=1 Tax=Pseudoprimorskyibacter insulae TaxID=1695997 RepID=A0A2R8AWW4_9RHOB|nr:hypothetical protein [Pseudoprimorskyibacter insulae]SPF80546.1 hypothetical protein PRI8871_02356 [Pseudoprimorskyibacter insulae]